MGGAWEEQIMCRFFCLFSRSRGSRDCKPGRIFGADVNGGPITIVDTSPNGYTLGSQVIETPNGSDIANAIPASPIVITPDTAPNIPWRGALVYINDLEGKITKINLSSNTKGYSNTSDIDVGTSVVDNATNVDSGTDVTTSGLVDGVTISMVNNFFS